MEFRDENIVFDVTPSFLYVIIIFLIFVNRFLGNWKKTNSLSFPYLSLSVCFVSQLYPIRLLNARWIIITGWNLLELF